MLNLRPYQKNCLEAIRKSFAEGTHRQLVSIATGGGKTIIFSHLIKEVGVKTLIIAHTNELLQQAKDKIQIVCPELDVGLLNADNKNFESDILVSSIQSARITKNLEELKKKGFQLLVYDEAHHCGSDSSRVVLNELGFGEGTANLLVGFTATGFRQDGKGLGKTFDEIVYEKPTNELIKEGYLSPVRGIKIATDIDFSKITCVNGDLQAESLADVMNIPAINQLVVDSWIEKAEGRQTIVFATTIKHAENLAAIFCKHGVKARCISGNTLKDERDRILNDYQNGLLNVICNCQLLTEGYDAPITSSILIARPTRSRGLYQQMAGRGLRLFPNKKDCVILDFSDGTSTLCNPSILMDDAECTLVIEAKEEAHIRSELLKSIPPNLNQKLKTALIAFDPLGFGYTWVKEDGSYTLRGNNTVLQILPSGKGLYFVSLSSKEINETLASNLTFEYGFSVAEDFARENKNLFIISDRNAEWRNLPASKGQLKYIRSKGYRAGIDKLNRGAASDLIGSRALWN